jgi:cupin 2 domain-containing protein
LADDHDSGCFKEGNLVNNLLASLPPEVPHEISEIILQQERFRLERIISVGQTTPPGEWYDQDSHEWVLILTGRAFLRFENESELCELGAGDCLLIPAHRRHRVEWTDPAQHTVWLALHYYA